MDNCEVHGPQRNDTGTCSCDKDREIDLPETVDNCVLAYCQAFLHNFDVITLAMSIDAYFSNEDLNAARKLLRDTFVKHITGMDIAKHKSRNISTQKCGTSAVAYDIVEAMYKLINQDIATRFIVSDISKLPILRPDMIEKKSIEERMLLLEKRMMKMEEWKTSNERTTEEHSVRIKSVENDHKPNRVNMQSEWPLPGTSNSKSSETHSYKSALRSVPNAPRFDRPLMAASSQESLVEEGEENGGTNDWSLQRHQKKQAWRQQKSKEAPRKKTQAIQGSAQGTELKAGLGPNRDLWIYNVDNEMEDDDLRTFIENGGSNKSGKVHIRLWEPRYKPEWDSKKFRITIGLMDYSRVFTEEFWPKDIFVRKYWVNFEKEKQNQRVNKNGESLI